MTTSTESDVSKDAGPPSCIRMGDALAAIGREIGLTDEDLAIFETIRDKTPAEPFDFDEVASPDSSGAAF